jgi:hypothetical protein
MASNEGVSLGQGKCTRATDKALLIDLESGDERWVPASVIHDDSEVYDSGDNSEGEVVVAKWWAEKEGLA